MATKTCTPVKDLGQYMADKGRIVRLMSRNKPRSAWFEVVSTGKQYGPCFLKGWAHAVTYAYAHGWKDMDSVHLWPQMAKEFKAKGIRVCGPGAAR